MNKILKTNTMGSSPKGSKSALGFIFSVVLLDVIGLAILMPIQALIVRQYSDEALMVAMIPVFMRRESYVLNKKEAYDQSSEEDPAYKMLTWAWHIDKITLKDMTHQQFATCGLMRLGKGEHLTRIVKSGLPRRLASKEEVLALKPELKQ